MAVYARTRIQREIDRLRQAEPSPYYSIYPHPDNIHVWSANIHGLPALHQHGKNYDLEITLPNNYPFIPPVVKVLGVIDHMHVDRRTNTICSDILGPMWTPSFTVEALVLAICSLLTDGEPTRRSPRLN